MASEGARVIGSRDDLLAPFHAGCRGSGGPRLLGTESEKFGVRAKTGKPVSYDGRACGILGYFARLCETGAWYPVHDFEGGPIIAVEQKREVGVLQVSLEPGAQLELSGAPVRTVHEVEDEFRSHLEDIRATSEACGVRWLAAGYHPLARPEDLPWVPKARYGVMRAYFPEVGTRGLDMMRRTATVQVNLDYADEEDAMRKLRVGLALSPIATAIFANSPFSEGAINGMKSERANVWLSTDRHRTGLVPSMWSPEARFETYAEWALDIPMYFFKRDGEIIANTGQTFRSFLAEGYRGHRAEQHDWVLHLNTLFPEVRLQKTLEFRSADALGQRYLPALPAFWAGLIYDETSLAAAEELVAALDHDALVAARADIARRGLGAAIAGRPVRALAEAAMEIALAGLGRRACLDAEGRDERRHLAPIAALVERGWCPADELLAGLDPNVDLRAQIIERCAV